MEEEGYERKISPVVAIFIGLCLLTVDIAEFALGLLLIDDFWILDILAGSIFFYITIKGIPPIRLIVGWLIEAIPYVGAYLPVKTISWGVTVWADWHPQSLATKTLTTASQYVPTGKGGVAASRMARQEQMAKEFWSKQDGVLGKTSLAKAAREENVAAGGGVSADTSQGATTAAGGRAYTESASGAPGTSATGATPASGGAQYAEDVQREQDSLLQLNKQLTQQTPGTIDRPTGGRGDVKVNDKTNTVQLPYAT